MEEDIVTITNPPPHKKQQPESPQQIINTTQKSTPPLHNPSPHKNSNRQQKGQIRTLQELTVGVLEAYIFMSFFSFLAGVALISK